MTALIAVLGIVVFAESMVIVAGYTHWRTANRAMRTFGSMLEHMLGGDDPEGDPDDETQLYGAHLPLRREPGDN